MLQPKLLISILLLFYSAFANPSLSLSEILKSPFVYKSGVSQKEVRVKGKLIITNQITKNNLNVSGKSIQIKITPPTKEKYFPYFSSPEKDLVYFFEGETDLNGEWELVFTNTTTPGEYRITTFFWDNQKRYHQNLIKSTFQVIDKKRIKNNFLIIFLCLILFFILSTLFFFLDLPSKKHFFYLSPVFFWLAEKRKEKPHLFFSSPTLFIFSSQLAILILVSSLLLLDQNYFFVLFLFFYILIFLLEKRKQTILNPLLLVKFVFIFIFTTWLKEYQSTQFFENWIENPTWISWAWLSIFLPIPTLFISWTFITIFFSFIFFKKMLLITIFSFFLILLVILFDLFQYMKKFF